MCGLYSMTHGREALRQFVDTLEVAAFPPRYKVGPGTDAIVLRTRDGLRCGEMIRWGFSPTRDGGHHVINARAETLFTNTMFEESALSRRCLVPADGFYEPRGQKRKGRAQFYFHFPDRELFAMAGIWTGSDLERFVLITTEPNDSVRSIHDRMPVVLEPASFDAWLDPKNQDVDELKVLLEERPTPNLMSYQVTEALYGLADGDSGCLAPAAQESLF